MVGQVRQWPYHFSDKNCNKNTILTSEVQTTAASCDTLASGKSASSTADLSHEVSTEPDAAQIP